MYGVLFGAILAGRIMPLDVKLELEPESVMRLGSEESEMDDSETVTRLGKEPKDMDGGDGDNAERDDSDGGEEFTELCTSTACCDHVRVRVSMSALVGDLDLYLWV
jgi:hypothetical protein